MTGTSAMPLATAADQDLPVLDMVQPLLGFPESRKFALARLDETGVLCELRSVDQPDLRFIVVPPAMFFPDYAPVVDDDVVAELEIASADDVLALLIINAAATLTETTANLRAPLLVNTRSRKAAQVILEDADLPLAAPLLG